MMFVTKSWPGEAATQQIPSRSQAIRIDHNICIMAVLGLAFIQQL